MVVSPLHRALEKGCSQSVLALAGQRKAVEA